MNSREFVAALKIVACDKAAMGVLENLRNPPGRRPDIALVNLSNWFKTLPTEDKAALEQIMNLATKQAVYNVLLVIDGLLTVSPLGNRVDFELSVIDGGKREVLNDCVKEPLTHLFKEK
jgi:hypothetical protein